MRVPFFIVPILIVVLTVAGVAGGRLVAFPSVTVDYPQRVTTPPAHLKTSVFVVDGVRCVDTARRAATTLEEVPGVVRFVAYASRNQVEITYDPSRTHVEVLREAIEGPVYNEKTGEILFHLFSVVEVDGVRL